MMPYLKYCVVAVVACAYSVVAFALFTVGVRDGGFLWL